MTQGLSADDLLLRIHDMIDKKFNRADRSKYVSPYLLKLKMTLWSMSGEFIDYDPGIILGLLTELVNRGSVVTNIGEDGVYPFDAYYIPKAELMDEKAYDIYVSVKKKIMK